jgi:tRNA1(Val) A37 N6-methylase TrmN6
VTVALRYKFIELSIVTEQTIEDVVNDWVGRGWQLEGIRFVTSEHTKRPVMAFVSFINYASDGERPREPHVIMAADNDVE